MTPLKSAPAKWIVCPAPDDGARLRLFCFAYAGGGASVFYPWKGMLPPGVELCALQMPGREVRLAERPIVEWPALVAQLEEALEPWINRPFAFFGHSLGAVIAFEVARALRHRGRPEPLHLFLSGRSAPQLPPDRQPVHALPDPEFIAEVGRLNGTPEEVLRNAELMELLIPVLRADFCLSESYRYCDEPALSAPISAYGGWKDEDTPSEKVAAWREQTLGPFRQTMFSGGHFFLNENRRELLAELSDELHETLQTLPLRI